MTIVVEAHHEYNKKTATTELPVTGRCVPSKFSISKLGYLANELMLSDWMLFLYIRRCLTSSRMYSGNADSPAFEQSTIGNDRPSHHLWIYTLRRCYDFNIYGAVLLTGYYAYLEVVSNWVLLLILLIRVFMSLNYTTTSNIVKAKLFTFYTKDFV